MPHQRFQRFDSYRGESTFVVKPVPFSTLWAMSSDLCRAAVKKTWKNNKKETEKSTKNVYSSIRFQNVLI